MRVAIVCGAGYVSGKEIMSLELADGLKEAGYNVSLAISLWGDGEFAGRAQKLGLATHPMRLGFISATLTFDALRMTADQLVHLPALWNSYARLLRKARPEKIIHTNWHHLILLLPFLSPKRDLFWAHEIFPNRLQYRTVFLLLARRLCRFVAVSKASACSILQLGVPSQSVTVIHNGLAEPQSRSVASERPRQLTRIGIVGQLGPWKGHEDLVNAFAILLPKHPKSELHIFGADNDIYGKYLRQLARDLHVDTQLYWHGFVSNRDEIYSNIDICAVPSRFEEPFGLVAVEAAMAGLPCIATRRGGLPEIVEHGVTGLLVDSQNPNQLVDALETLISNAHLRAQMGSAARQRARERFGRGRLVKEFAELLGKC